MPKTWLSLTFFLKTSNIWSNQRKNVVFYSQPNALISEGVYIVAFDTFCSILLLNCFSQKSRQKAPMEMPNTIYHSPL